ncbi:hypothetical protein S40285_09948 [Stachybotrys chlorohalonatus IBT 40285]|uniref:Uncharacterized protein n=1 Tax=Stachybotrys chlorohalonatus (strain IBT 40285) TaxID=1283841 RepID=A0A084QIM1_STAC4|nr:hypothetical protein S40285_09948 [Stachybotrys chlorohalonata IBT 40285]
MSGGFYRYRCKYFFSHNCPNWVWVNNSPCATCLAEGRDTEQTQPSSWTMLRDIVVPRVQNGVLQYTLMEFVAPTYPGDNWTLRDKVDQHPLGLPPATVLLSAPILATAGSSQQLVS